MSENSKKIKEKQKNDLLSNAFGGFITGLKSNKKLPEFFLKKIVK
jgi:hypothetical protein